MTYVAMFGYYFRRAESSDQFGLNRDRAWSKRPARAGLRMIRSRRRAPQIPQMIRSFDRTPKHRELRSQMLAMAFRTGRFLTPENQGLEPVLALGANVFKNRHV